MNKQDRATPFAETLEALDKLHKAGKFVRLGISNFTAFEVAEVCMMCKYNHWVRPTVYQGETKFFFFFVPFTSSERPFFLFFFSGNVVSL